MLGIFIVVAALLSQISGHSLQLGHLPAELLLEVNRKLNASDQVHLAQTSTHFRNVIDSDRSGFGKTLRDSHASYYDAAIFYWLQNKYHRFFALFGRNKHQCAFIKPDEFLSEYQNRDDDIISETLDLTITSHILHFFPTLSNMTIDSTPPDVRFQRLIDRRTFLLQFTNESIQSLSVFAFQTNPLPFVSDFARSRFCSGTIQFRNTLGFSMCPESVVTQHIWLNIIFSNDEVALRFVMSRHDLVTVENVRRLLHVSIHWCLTPMLVVLFEIVYGELHERVWPEPAVMAGVMHRCTEFVEVALTKEWNDVNVKMEDGLMALHKAAEKGDARIFEIVLNATDSELVTAVDGHGRNMAHYAAYSGNVGILMVIFKRMPQLFSMVNKKRETPILEALKADQGSAVLYLAKVTGLELKFEDIIDYPKTLLLALQNGLFSIPESENKEFICSMFDPKYEGALSYLVFTQRVSPQTECFGRPLLHHSIISSFSVFFIHLLLSHGADPCIQDTDGRTAFIHAMRLHHPLKFTIGHYSPSCLNLPDSQSKSALWYALESLSQSFSFPKRPPKYKLDPLISFLPYLTPSLFVKEKEFGLTPFLFVAKMGWFSLFKEMVEVVDIHTVDDEGNNVLSLLASFKHSEGKEMMRMVLERGCDLNWRNKKGETPLIMAAKIKAKANVRFLVALGADKSLKDDDGNRAIDYWPINKFLEI